MEKYEGLIDATLHLLAEAAKLTEQTWDDTAVAAARAVFERVFGPVRFGAEPMMATQAEQVAVHEAGLPPWAVPLLLEVIKWALNRWVR